MTKKDSQTSSTAVRWDAREIIHLFAGLALLVMWLSHAVVPGIKVAESILVQFTLIAGTLMGIDQLQRLRQGAASKVLSAAFIAAIEALSKNDKGGK